MVYLDGVAGEEVISEGVRLVTRLTFIYSILVRPSKGQPNLPFYPFYSRAVRNHI